MGKLQNKNTLTTKPASEIVTRPLAGWTWYCGYHDTAGQGDDFEEVQFMVGCHIVYHENVYDQHDVCEPHYREHKERKEA